MAVDIKVAPDEKLELVQTYITDTNPNSDYFNSKSKMYWTTIKKTFMAPST